MKEHTLTIPLAVEVKFSSLLYAWPSSSIPYTSIRYCVEGLSPLIVTVDVPPETVSVDSKSPWMLFMRMM